MAELAGPVNLAEVRRYYNRTESRLGYRLLLGQTRHFGWYEPGHRMWRFSAAMRRMEDVLGQRLALPAGAAVLDAGCGVGDVARGLATRFSLDVTGIDLLAVSIRTARRRSSGTGLADRTRFHQRDYHDLDFPDGQFDGAYTMETLVHSARPRRVLAELYRVLRPGGTLVMFEYSRTPPAQLRPAADEALRRVCELGAMPGWLALPHGELERLARQAGFVVSSVEDVTARMLPMLQAFAILGRLPYLAGRAVGRVDKVVNAMSGVELYRHQDAWRYQIYTATRPA